MNNQIKTNELLNKIVYVSWGYDQTNVDFYQIVKVTPKTVVLRELKSQTVEDSFMAGKTVPVLNEFKEEKTYRAVIDEFNGNVTFKSSLDYAGYVRHLHLWNGEPVRCSWYA